MNPKSEIQNSKSAGQVVLAVDQGTTRTKSFILNSERGFKRVASLAHKQIYPRPGWVEHDPAELLGNVMKCLAKARGVSAMGLANQGETVVAWDSGTGRPICNAIVWQDQRTYDLIRQLKADGAEELTLSRAGLPLDPYFSAPKLKWIIDNITEARSLLRKNRLRVGTSDSFFLDRLAGVYATDVTTASRTSLMNLRSLEWDAQLCGLFGIPLEILPEIRPTTGEFGSVRTAGGMAPVTASAVDQQAALFGHQCFEPGQVKVTFGTGAFALANAGSTIHRNPDSRMTATVAWKLGDKSPVYAVEGGVYSAASAVDWIKQAGLISRLNELNRLGGAPAAASNTFFVPALSGLACPHWDRTASGLWIGLGLGTTKEDLIKSVLEGVAFRTFEVLSSLWDLVGASEIVSIDGGLTNSSYFCQFLANVLDKNLRVPGTADMTAVGTAYLAMIGATTSGRQIEFPDIHLPETVISPTRDFSVHYGKFRDAVSRSKGWRT
ncbi:glycerol kinase [Candidatus Poribacteria bacterium]|nr:glycerol kinase [Candidatus Poribacteria bacterium]